MKSDSGTEIVKQFEQMAKSRNCTAAQLCLAWIMAQGEDFIPIPGTTSVNNLKSNLASSSITLSKDELQAIRELIKQVSGEKHYIRS